MRAEAFVDAIDDGFFSGVPDSLLRPFCDDLIMRFGLGRKNIIAINEGNAIALAAGYHLATGRIPVVYMQNSGIGNATNALLSLMHDSVFGIPCVLVIGWRGEPGVIDEPQHRFQGEVTLEMLSCMGIQSFVVDRNTSLNDVCQQMDVWKPLLEHGRQVAFVVRNGAMEGRRRTGCPNKVEMTREDVLRAVLALSGSDRIICTTGKASRELFELRDELGQGHEKDFLVVGSMGHASSVALSYALQRPSERIWCIDGDGAVLMHMGAMALLGSMAQNNLIHLVVNNGAHESVGGAPTVANDIRLTAIAKDCGYRYVARAIDQDTLADALKRSMDEGPAFVEAICSIGSRSNLGRPTISPQDNKAIFMGSDV